MRYLIVLLALAGLVDSVLALRIHMQDPNAAPPCAVTEKWDCGTVNHSRFAVFPAESFDEQPGSKKIHIPVATLGIIGYGLIALTALAGLDLGDAAAGGDWLLLRGNAELPGGVCHPEMVHLLRLVAGVHYGDSVMQHCVGDFEVPAQAIATFCRGNALTHYNSVHVAQGFCTAD